MTHRRTARRLRPVGLAALAAAALALGGCAQTFDATTLGVPVSMGSPAGQPPQGQPFTVTSRSVYGFWGLVPLKRAQLAPALATQLIGGKAVAGVRIRVRSRWSDVLVSALTLGIIVPRAVTFEGVVTGP